MYIYHNPYHCKEDLSFIYKWITALHSLKQRNKQNRQQHQSDKLHSVFPPKLHEDNPRPLRIAKAAVSISRCLEQRWDAKYLMQNCILSTFNRMKNSK